MNAPATAHGDSNSYLLSDPVRSIETSVSDASEKLRDTSAGRWQDFIDRILIPLGARGQDQADDDYPLPSREIVGLACDIARGCRDAGDEPPTSVHRDADGGIVFERLSGTEKQVIHIWDDASVEFLKFENRQLVERSTIMQG